METERERLTYTIDECSKILGLSRYLTYQAARNGSLPVLKFGRRLVVPKYGLEQMLKEAGSHTQQVHNDDQ